MKRFFKLLVLIFVLITLTFSFACSYAPSMGLGGPAFDMDTDAGSSDSIPESDIDGDGSQGTAGRMSAAAHDDNKYYSLYKSLFERGQAEEANGKFYNFIATSGSDWGLNGLNRVKVTVSNGTNPVANTQVTFESEDGTRLYGAVTDSKGVAYIFNNTDGGKITVHGKSNKISYVTAEDEEVSIDIGEDIEKKAIIEIMLVVDVTGSMGDELGYLRTELKDVVNRISQAFSNIKLSLSMLFYRDDGDDEKFAYSDFLDVTVAENLSKQQAAINAQRATGGGDYEEAVDEALELAVSKQWSDNSTKIIFHVLDAPPHSDKTNRERYAAAVNGAAEKGIRICPILASGADTLTEYLTRQAALLTGGTFCFITDHSGIGNSHYDPEIPNVVVEKLNDLMVRLVKGYYTGEFEAPVAYDGNTYYSVYYDSIWEDFIISGAKYARKEGQQVVIVTNYPEGFNSETDMVFLSVNGETSCEGEVIVDTETQEKHLQFTFTMPKGDVIIDFEFSLQNPSVD